MLLEEPLHRLLVACCLPGTNYTGYEGAGSAATAPPPAEINNLVTPEERVSLDSEWSVDPFEFDASSGVDYDTAFQDWELDKDYNEGGA